MKLSYKSAFILITFFASSILCDDEGHGHDHEEHEQERIHTIHHHHIQKYDVIKKIEVPVIKEIKVPYYVYVPFKQPYPYHVKPYIVKVPIHYYHTKTEEHGHVNVIPAHEDHHEHGHEHVEEEAHHSHSDDEHHSDGHH